MSNIRRRRIFAEDEMPEMENEGGVEVAPEASALLFEAEDVAELVAEITGQPVEVTAEDSSVTFAVGDDEFTVEAEGDEEVLEAVRRPLRNKRQIKASASRRPLKSSSVRRPSSAASARRRVSASTQVRKTSKTVRKVPNRK